MTIFAELKRRNVFRVALAYMFTGWVLIEVATTVLPIFGAPDWVAKVFVFAVALGFVPVLIFSWAYEITPEGIKKESEIDQSQSISSDTGRKLDRVIILVLTIAVVIFAVDKFSVSPEPTSPATTAGDSSSETQQQSIAVLPFVNISSDLEQEYFSDGLSEELLNLLAKIPELRVTSRSSAFSYKGKDFKIADVGRELNVRHVLEGSVRKSGDKVRITAQLIDVASDAHIWSETWDRTLDDVFVIQDEIALAVVNALKIELLDAAPTAATTSGDVFTLFLEARYLVVERSESGFKKAEKLLKEALEIDPNYAPAWSGLANVYARGARMGAWPVHEAARLSREAAHRALAIDPSDGRAHGVLSEIAGIQDRDIETSEEHLRKALLLEPGNSDVLLHATESAMRTGHYEQCLYYADRALVLDPLNFTIYTAKGYCHYFLGENDAAIAALQKKISVNPEAFGAHYYLASVYAGIGDFDRALVAIEKEVSTGYVYTGRAIIQHGMGNSAASDAALKELIAGWPVRNSYQIAIVYAYRGETEKALQWLQTAYDTGDMGLMLILGDPMLNSIRDEPAFNRIVDDMGLELTR